MIFGKQDLIALGKGLLITMAGSGLAYLSTFLSHQNFGIYTAIIVTVGALVINMLRKALDGVKV